MPRPTRITMIEPYYGGSHRRWIDGYRQHSHHQINLLSMPAQFWKWRMQGGAVTMAKQFNALPQKPDLLIISDMLNVATFRALTRTDIPISLYFHENQLTYPQNRRQHHGWRYGFINYISALTADTLLFNSEFHREDFFTELPRMLKHFPDYNELDTLETLRTKSQVLPLGIDLARFDQHRTSREGDKPLILWNHRWEADKNPTAFVEALLTLASEGFDFEIAIAGRNFRQHPTEFEQLRTELSARFIHYGYTKSFVEYARLLWQADYIISPSYQDFFGIAVTEAIYCHCVPLLANRLNYPYLIPADYHAQCLFRDGALTGLLRQHLLGNLTVDTAQLRAHVTQYDWQNMITRYDDTFANLASQ